MRLCPWAQPQSVEKAPIPPKESGLNFQTKNAEMRDDAGHDSPVTGKYHYRIPNITDAFEKSPIFQVFRNAGIIE